MLFRSVMPPQDANTAAFLDDHVGMTSLVQAFGHSTSFHVNWVGVDESASMKLMLSHLAEYNANSIAFLSGNANIRRVRQRIEELSNRSEFAGWTFPGGEAKINEAENRLQLIFEEKPDADQRQELKSNGFSYLERIAERKNSGSRNIFWLVWDQGIYVAWKC